MGKPPPTHSTTVLCTNLGTPVNRGDVPAGEVGVGVPVGVAVLVGQLTAVRLHEVQVAVGGGAVASVAEPENKKQRIMS